MKVSSEVLLSAMASKTNIVTASSTATTILRSRTTLMVLGDVSTATAPATSSAWDINTYKLNSVVTLQMEAREANPMADFLQRKSCLMECPASIFGAILVTHTQ